MWGSNWPSARILLVACLALLLSACSLIRDQLDPTTVSIRGIPPTLEQLNISTTASAQNLMVNELIQTAGLSSQPSSDDPKGDPKWSLVMKAGVYEIGRQCDQYLDALFRFNREQRAGRQDLAAAAAATGAIMGISGASAKALAITAAAFGLASSLFDASVNSVLFTIEPSALRNVALQGRKNYLDDFKKNNVQINTRPDMLIALQGYLTQCSPAAIEANINNAASGSPFAVTNPDKDKARDAALLAAPGTALIVPPVVTPPAPEKPQEAVRPRVVVVPPVEAKYRPFLVDPSVPHDRAQLERAFAALCVLPTELNDTAAKTTARIKAFQQAENYRHGKPMPSATGVLTSREIEILKGRPKCDRERFQNIFESYYIWGQGPPKDAKINSVDLIRAINKNITDPGRKLSEDGTASMDAVRSRIPDLREALASQLALTDSALSDQLTRDLWNILLGIK